MSQVQAAQFGVEPAGHVWTTCSRIFRASLLLVFLAVIAGAQVSIQGVNPSITITTGVAGGQPVPVQDASTRVRYRQDRNVVTKITVQTSCPGQRFSLSALALAPGDGNPAPEVVLTNGGPAVDFITNIPAGNKNLSANIQYTASATFAQGNSAELGNDVHTVTYTLIAQ